ncbi:MAG: uracil-DNA glycosylase family protein [Flavobacteriaceae bacterium]
MPNHEYWEGRGVPWEHDPGPPKNMSWARLFSETPNYRGLATQYMGREKFRWHFGPMHYRGRLKKDQVKVLIIGQEGAMDESLAHRAFVGSSGGRMQHILDYLGIDFSYLFLNTFLYPINGQYSERKIKVLGQHAASPIAEQRNEILNYAKEKNDLRLIIAVGTAAKETVCTWIERLGGNCPDGIEDISTADSHLIGPKAKAIGIIHPGALHQADMRDKVLEDYKLRIAQLAEWVQQDADWLPVDPGMQRDFSIPFEILKKPIPFRDLPVGVSWRLGNGTSAGRRLDDQRTIQLSAKIPSGERHDTFYRGLAKGSEEGYSEEEGDVPYEPPVHDYEAYDMGPPDAFLKLIMGGYPGKEWPDFEALGVNAHPSLGGMPLFRGRPDKTTILVLADPQSVDDLFSMRALCGKSGQHFQGFLNAAGVPSRYCILRSLPVDVTGMTLSQRIDLVQHPQVKMMYKTILEKVLDYNDAAIILLMGPMAQEHWKLAGITTDLPIITLKNRSQRNWLSNWQHGLTQLSALNYPKEISASFQYEGSRSQIPRFDLPYGFLRWQGTSGDRAKKAKRENGEWSPYYYKWFAPDWVFRSDPKPLSSTETELLNQFPD